MGQSTNTSGTGQIGYSTTLGNVIEFSSTNPPDKTIVHEVGHALGFAHEHVDQVPVNCAQRTSGNQLGTQADRDSSVMSQTACNAASRLSPWDIVGVQNAYGHRRSGSLVGLNGLCVDVPNGASATSGADLQVYDCNGGTNQVFRTDVSRSLIPLAPSGFVVDIETGGSGTGLAVQIFGSSGLAHQKWKFEGVEIRGIGEKCLDIPDGSIFPGQRIQTFACKSVSNQKWNIEFRNASTIKIRPSNNPSFCVEVPSGATSGTDLTLASCAATSRQEFSTTALGELKNAGLCLDSEWGDVVDGRTLQVFTCRGDDERKENQQFHLRGNVRSDVGTCLGLRNTDPRTNTGLMTMSCSSNADRVWDYYF